MAGIIDAATRGVYIAVDGTQWTYFQDVASPATFYVVGRPTIAIQNGIPAFHLTTYTTQGAFVSALLQLTTALAPPPLPVQQGIADVLAKKVTSPTYQAMPYVDLGTGVERNRAYLSYASADGSVSRTTSTTPSLSGAETAVFEVPNLTASEVAFLTRYFSGDLQGGTVEVAYELTVVARLGGVTARVQFNASSAYEYERTFKWVS